MTTASSLPAPSPSVPTAQTRKEYFVPLTRPLAVVLDFLEIFVCCHGSPGWL